MSDKNRVTVANVGLSHPDRVLFPEAGATKLDLARYYETIADVDRRLLHAGAGRCNGVGAGDVAGALARAEARPLHDRHRADATRAAAS